MKLDCHWYPFFVSKIKIVLSKKNHKIMKRIFTLSILVIASVTSTFASNNAIIEKLNDKKTFNRVVSFLGADNDQEKDLKYVFQQSNKIYEKSLNAGYSESEAADKALNFSLGNSRVILSKKQYVNLLKVINSTNNNLNDIYAELK